MSIHVVVMGVAGCGKSTVAEAIHERLGYVYAEGDDFHPQANIDKMSAGIPLTDEDRWPWLNVINSWMVAREALGENTVVSSSALKRSYREVLAKDVPTFFIHLNGSHELIQQRLSERKGHFMPPALLPSQFAILEPLVPEENGVEISIEGSVDEMVDLHDGHIDRSVGELPDGHGGEHFEEAHFWLVEFFHLHVDHGYKVFDLIPGINEIVVGKLLAVDGDALVDMFKMR